MASGDIPGGGSKIDQAQKGVDLVDSFVSLFRGKTSSNTVNDRKNVDLTTVNTEEVSSEKAAALLQQLLGSIQGLAAVSSGQKATGMYDSTTSSQLTNDLLARSTADVAALSSVKVQQQAGTIDDTQTQQQHSKGALEWIICTELNKQGRLPNRYYRYGARVFASYSAKSKQGYYIWAVPAVRHLRKYPESRLSKLMEVVFNARAEYLAAKAGCKDAKKTVLGFLTTHVLFVVCVALSRTIAREPINFMAVYSNP